MADQREAKRPRLDHSSDADNKTGPCLRQAEGLPPRAGTSTPQDQTKTCHQQPSTSMATDASEENECPLCLDIFKTPKFLPCFHTFCQHCIEGLLKGKTDITFPCPSCRETTTLPPGGAAALRTNFYIRTSTPSSPTPAQVPAPVTEVAQDMCDTHPDEKLVRFCTECEGPMCVTCKWASHDTHKTEDINLVVMLKKQEMESDRQRLEKAVIDIKNDVKALKEKKQALRKQEAAVERSIRERHAAAVERMRQHMEEQLQNLRSKCSDQDTDVDKIIKEREVNTAKLSTLLQHVDDMLSSGTAKDILSFVKCGRGSQSAVESLASREQRPTLRPDLLSTVSHDDMVQTTRDYLGTVCMLEMKVTHKFQCSQDPDTEVFSLCHVDYDPPGLYVSFDRLGKNENAPVQLFRESGLCFRTHFGVGRMSCRRHTKGRGMHHPTTSGLFATCNKSPASLHFELKNNMSGQANINRITVTSMDPLKAEDKTEFTINIGRHRAFDVDGSENYFAVVEEGKTDSSTRQVHLYEKPKKEAVSTYDPPMENFQPTDVLFHTLGGQPVLLVADQLNSALHVLSFQGGQLEFQCFLCAGCPLLQQPSALTVDVEGRLWLACKEGRILTIENFK